MGKRDGGQGAANAISNQIDFSFRAYRCHHIHRIKNAALHVGVPSRMGKLRARVHPRQNKHGVALVYHPFDQRFLFVQIEDIVFIDPRRDHENWLFSNFLSGGRILDDLANFILKNHVTLGGR